MEKEVRRASRRCQEGGGGNTGGLVNTALVIHSHSVPACPPSFPLLYI